MKAAVQLALYWLCVAVVAACAYFGGREAGRDVGAREERERLGRGEVRP